MSGAAEETPPRWFCGGLFKLHLFYLRGQDAELLTVGGGVGDTVARTLTLAVKVFGYKRLKAAQNIIG